MFAPERVPLRLKCCFFRSMFFDANFSFCNGLDSSAFFHLAMGWIPPPMFALVLQWAGFPRPIFNFAMGWIAPLHFIF